MAESDLRALSCIIGRGIGLGIEPARKKQTPLPGIDRSRQFVETCRVRSRCLLSAAWAKDYRNATTTVNDATFDKLELHEVRETLASYCGSSLGKRLARSMTPATKTRQVREWLDQVRELMVVAEEYSMPPLGGVHDIREQVRAAAFPAPLEPDALADIAETLSATANLCGWFEKIGDTAPSLQRLGQRVENLSFLADVINEVVDSRGKVRDYASPKLAAIRGTIEQARGRIKKVFDRILRQSSLANMLQYSGATFHGDRMVLPLRAEYRGRIAGIIHRTSDSGSTLFVEPAESVELNNSIIRLRDEESKEVTRLLREISRQVHQSSAVILSTLRAIGVVDLIAAKCKYGRHRRCTCPRLSENGVLDVHQARHPVLIELFEREAREGAPPRVVVPIDVRVGDDFDILVVTGPNTGGKTVAIKTVGLLALMTQCGIPIPAGRAPPASTRSATRASSGMEREA